MKSPSEIKAMIQKEKEHRRHIKKCMKKSESHRRNLAPDLVRSEEVIFYLKWVLQ